MLKLGGDFYAKTKTENVLEIIEGRMKKVEEDIKKWKGLKT